MIHKHDPYDCVFVSYIALALTTRLEWEKENPYPKSSNSDV